MKKSFFSINKSPSNSLFLFAPTGGVIGKDGGKVTTTVIATPGSGPDRDRPQEVTYTDTKVIGNGSFGVVYQAKLFDTGELIAIKKVLQDKRFKVSLSHQFFVLSLEIPPAKKTHFETSSTLKLPQLSNFFNFQTSSTLKYHPFSFL